MTEAFGRIEDGDTDRMSADDTGIVDPISGFSPDCFFALGTGRIGHLDVWTAEFRSEADREGAFLGVAEIERTGGGGQDDLAIDDTGLRVALERERLQFFTDDAV